MRKSILITQCLQNDFVQPVALHETLPNHLHIGFQESKRLIGENPKEGMLMRLMAWAYGNESGTDIINIRDWHGLNDPSQLDHLNKFGAHCIKNTVGAQFVFESCRDTNREKIVDASGLNDFIDTDLKSILDSYGDEKIRVGIIGVWTEAKVSFLSYELATRYPNFDISICSALTASSSTHMHFIALEQLKNLLDLKILPSITEFASFLKGESVELNSGLKQIALKAKITYLDEANIDKEEQELIAHLFRNSKSIEFKILDGGFSGNIVMKAKSIDIHGHEEVPVVLKIGPRNPMAQERESFEKIRDVLGNNAPSIVDYLETENKAGIKYRYASMFDEKIQTFQNFYADCNDDQKIKYFLDVIFKKQLGRFYKAATLEKMDLIQYYDFSSKYADSVKSKIEAIIGVFNENDESILIEDKPSFNLVKFYKNDIDNLKGKIVQSHYQSYLHGDLNGANIIIDAQDNVWLIDFFHTHRGHVLKDLIKLENDLLYIFMDINSREEYIESTKLIDIVLNTDDLWADLPNITYQFLQINKAYSALKVLRSYYKNLVQSDRGTYQLFIGLLRYSVHTLSFEECNLWQKKLALYSSCILAEKVQQYVNTSTKLRIDYIKEIPEQIGMTILPGRRDRGRNIEEDVKSIVDSGIENIVTLITESELESYGVPNLIKTYNENGISTKHVSIVDQGIPTIEELDEIVDWMDAKFKKNEKVLVHCVGGLGRTGTIVAAYLKKYRRYSTEEAINMVRKSRSPRAIETKIQEGIIADFLS